MLDMESPHAGTYAPLSQAMTDSESDEEIIHKASSAKQRHQQFFQPNGRPGNRVPPNTLALHSQQPPQHQRQLQLERQQRQRKLMQEQLHQHQQQKNQHNQRAVNGNAHQPSSYTTNMQNTFRSVMMSNDLVHNNDVTQSEASVNLTNLTTFPNFHSDYDERNHIEADNVAILGSSYDSKDPHSNEPMSPMRRCCFVGSLLLCLVAVVGFVWWIPCDEGSACPAPLDRAKTHNWMNNYTRIELKGGVNLVNGQRNWEKNLLFLYRGDAFFPESHSNKRNGVVSLIGSSGAIAWFVEMTDEPVAIDCALLDVDLNGRTDCLIIDEYGELGALNPLTGQWLWRFAERSAHKVDAYDFPLLLPDLDGDGVFEILTVSSEDLMRRTKGYVRQGEVRQDREARNVLRILSGRSGTPIGEGFQIRDCDALRKIQLENSQRVTFNCLRNKTEAQRSKSLAELFALITNKSIVGGRPSVVPAPDAEIAQHRHYGQRREIDAQRNIYSLSGRELVVENRGKCPEDCNVTLILSEYRQGRVNVLRNFTNSGVYGMVPAQWHFKDTAPKMSGFVMKFWRWNNRKDVPPTQDNANKAAKNKTKAKAKENGGGADNRTKQQRHRKRALWEASPGGEFDAFDHVVMKRHAYTTSSDAQSTNATKAKKIVKNLLLENYRMQTITETEILVLFIGAETRIENTSQSNIVQFCRTDRAEVVCQPDLNNQENSMLIADLDQDGSQELVSYTTTFVQTDDGVEGTDEEEWKLVTYVRLLRLQAELPAFYEDSKRREK